MAMAMRAVMPARRVLRKHISTIDSKISGTPFQAVKVMTFRTGDSTGPAALSARRW